MTQKIDQLSMILNESARNRTQCSCKERLNLNIMLVSAVVRRPSSITKETMDILTNRWLLMRDTLIH